MDIMDVSGEHEVNVHHTIYKTRLDTNGEMVEKKTHKLTDSIKTNISLPQNYCGGCYGGKKPKSGCCQTCDDVEQAYQEMGWALENHSEIEQCIRENYDANIKAQKN